MKTEPATWMRYAEENLAVARLSFEEGLQNAQQCIEKALKALIIENGLAFKRTHSIQELTDQLTAASVDAGLSEDECELIDAIYLPSKYPVASVVPDLDLDADLCRHCIDTAQRVIYTAKEQRNPEP